MCIYKWYNYAGRKEKTGVIMPDVFKDTKRRTTKEFINRKKTKNYRFL